MKGVKLLTAGNDFSGDTNDKLLSTAERRLVEAGNIATISSQEEVLPLLLLLFLFISKLFSHMVFTLE